MSKAKTHFEQIPVEIVKTIVDKFADPAPSAIRPGAVKIAPSAVVGDPRDGKRS